MLGHGLQPPTVHPSHISPTPTFLNLDMSKALNEMSQQKHRDELYILTARSYDISHTHRNRVSRLPTCKDVLTH